jgi:hypothetical protein
LSYKITQYHYIKQFGALEINPVVPSNKRLVKILQIALVLIPFLFLFILVLDGHLEITALPNVHAVFLTCLKSQLVTLRGDKKFDLLVVILLRLNISIDKGTDILPDTTVHCIATQPFVLVHCPEI